MKSIGWSQGLSVTADGTGMVPLAGAAAVRLLADRVGLTDSVVGWRWPVAGSSRSMTAGGCWSTWPPCSPPAVRRSPTSTRCVTRQPARSGRVAGDGVAGVGRGHPGRVEADRRGPGQGPPARLVVAAGRAAGGAGGRHRSRRDVVLDVDATLVTAHSEKEQAAANFKGGFGFHPLGVWCDNTGELLAIRLRPGNANANHAQDHIDLLGDAISQIPAASPQDAGPGRLGRGVASGAGLAHRTGPGPRPARWSTRSDSQSTKESRSTTPSTRCLNRLGPRRWMPTVRSVTAPGRHPMPT